MHPDGANRQPGGLRTPKLSQAGSRGLNGPAGRTRVPAGWRMPRRAIRSCIFAAFWSSGTSASLAAGARATWRRAEVPRPRAQRGPEWFGHLGRPARDAPRGATEPTTSRQVAAAVVGLAGLDAGCAYTLTVVEHRVRASLMRRIGLVERVSLRVHRKEWRVAADETWRQSADWAWLAPAP
jgi:hypothetical protein